MCLILDKHCYFIAVGFNLEIWKTVATRVHFTDILKLLFALWPVNFLTKLAPEASSYATFEIRASRRYVFDKEYFSVS